MKYVFAICLSLVLTGFSEAGWRRQNNSCCQNTCVCQFVPFQGHSNCSVSQQCHQSGQVIILQDQNQPVRQVISNCLSGLCPNVVR